MPDLVPLSLQSILRQVGRGKVFYGKAPAGGIAPWTPGSGEIVMTHLGDTEGDITLDTNPEVSAMTLPEVTGPARQTAFYTGENPVLSIPLFLADPALLPIITPTGSKHAGNSFRRRVNEYTLAILPESLFLQANADGTFTQRTVDFQAGAWHQNAVAFTTAQQAILDMAIWLWRGYFNRPPRRFIGAPEGKNIETVSFQVMYQPLMPEGHMLYTQGDPSDYGINLEA